MKKIAPYLIFLAAMLWATDAPFRIHLTKELSSNFIVLAEHFVDILFVLPIVFLNWRQIKALTMKQWLAVIAIAVGGSALASVAFTQAFHYVDPSVAILLQKLQPLIAIGLAYAMLHEELSPTFWLWAVGALLGAYIISFPKFIIPFTGDVWHSRAEGVALALVAALLWGASTVLGKYVLQSVEFKTMTALRFVTAFLFLAILNVSEHSLPVFSRVTGMDWIYIVIIALASGVFSLMLYYRGLQDTKASVATLAELGFPMAAVLVNWIFLKDVLVPMQLLGMAILLFSVFQLGKRNAENAPKLVLQDQKI